LIQVTNLVKRYGEKEALGGISFSIEPGEIVGLLGLNGAGKSTTMNILTGYISSSAGTVSIDGHDIVKEPTACKRVIGYLPEQFSFYPDMRVREYLDFVCDLKGFSPDPAKRKQHLRDICARVGISKMTGRMIRNLSKGYKQRVGFAQALVGNPKVLILDEPTVGLDPSQIIEIRQLIKDSGKDSTVIVSSHILSEIQAICSRVIVIHEGRIIADGAPERLMQDIRTDHRLAIRVQGTQKEIEAALNNLPKVRSVKALPQRELGTQDFLVEGKLGSDIRADVFYALAKANLPLLHTYGGELSLEDVFLHLTAGRGNAREEVR
jgi:ABC-2 type transport system ATP-binding protein